MTITASVFIATSLDGYIARRDGSLDWLDEANACVPAGEDCGYRTFMDSVDTLIMGRNTYEKVLTFGAWPYGGTPVIVLSHRPLAFPPHLPDTVSHSAESPRALFTRMAGQGERHVYVDGANTIQRFLAASLIDRLTLTTIPVILGDGIPLFGPGGRDIRLTHVSTMAYYFGFVQSTYLVNRGD